MVLVLWYQMRAKEQPNQLLLLFTSFYLLSPSFFFAAATTDQLSSRQYRFLQDTLQAPWGAVPREAGHAETSHIGRFVDQ